MLRRRSNARSGITLTEILISIMIMGVGMVSVATLFPIGLMRMRDATRDARSTILAQSAKADADIRGLPNAKGLVNPDSFLDLRLPWYAAWRNPANWPLALRAGYPFTITPLTYDLDTIANDPNTGVFADFFSPGLPVAYDPLFWATTHYSSEGLTPEQTPLGLRGTLGSEGRFGSGIGLIRAGAAAHGLQRITNFEPYQAGIPWPYTYSLASTPPGLEDIAEVAGKVFTSLDDPVLTSDETGQSGVPVVPVDFDPGAGYAFQRNYEFSWMLTGRLGVAGDPSTFEGNIVVFHRRPMGLDPAPSPTNPGNSVLVPTGERVVEAVWGYTNTSAALTPINNPVPAIAGSGYSGADDRTVLLRWPATSNDPLIRVGDYIADVTYERFRGPATTNYPPDNPATGQNGVLYSGQRIHWYRIVQKGQVEPDPAVAGHFRTIVRVDTPLLAKTRLVLNGGQVESAVPEAALLCPYVVNVFPVLLYSR